MEKFSIGKKFVLLSVGILFLGGCVTGITVAKKDLKVGERTDVEYRLGTDVAMDEWVSLKKNVCDDLPYATEGIPDDTRQKILKYACVESDSYELGKTFAALKSDQMEKICARLSEKGYTAQKDQNTPGMENLALPPLFILVLLLI